MTERCTKDHSMRLLLQSGINIPTILDVGVQYQTRELRENFIRAKHVLFEPVVEYHSEIRKNYAGRDFDLFEVALSDVSTGGHLQVFDVTGSGSVSHSSLSTDPEGSGREISALRLDDFMSERHYETPYLLKIDVDGNELKILSGAEKTLQQCACVVVECPISIDQNLFFERAQFLKERGFVLWDIVDFCYYKNELSQVDLIFLNDDLKRSKFSPWSDGPFEVEKWETKWQ